MTEPLRLEIYPEIHCDTCNDVVHNHMSCPACGYGDAGTDQYRDLGYHETPEDVRHGLVIACESCGARFRLMKLSEHGTAYGDTAEWERVAESETMP